MNVAVEQLTKPEISKLVAESIAIGMSPAAIALFNTCIMRSASMWVGFIDGDLACVYGLVPPTLLSDQAYLWLHTTEALVGHEFLFVRRSQIAVAEMLLVHPIIIGHAEVGNTRGIRWLKWLGAVFGDPDGRLIPFTIRGKNNG